MGNILHFNFEKFVCCDKVNINEQTNMVDKKLIKYTKENDILLIPMINGYELDNLYPVADQVEFWNIFIIGCDKTYICAQNIDFCKEEEILNKSGVGAMEERIFDFLDKIWTETLADKQIQIFVYLNSKLYLLNSYPFKNKKDIIIGACCFIREAGLIDKKAFDLKEFEKKKNIKIIYDNLKK